MNPSAAVNVLRDSHLLIMTGGLLGVFSVLAGLLSRRIGAPVLLVFLVIGMLAGDDGLLGIKYDDYGSSYLIGSVALAVILFQGGLKTPLPSIRRVIWPAALLATLGVAVTTFIVGGLVALI
jgi:cell volume regulation protein A